MSQTFRVPILMYHKVERLNRKSTVQGHYVSPQLFRRQMALLSVMGYTAVPLTTLISLAEPKGKWPRKPVVITFDDGYQNFHQNALPVLKTYGFTSTVFLVANQLGGTNAWDTKEGDVEERLMTVAEIQEASAAGTEFGSHTLDHADLPAVSGDEAWRQIEGSKRKLETDLEVPIRSFCYPYGRKSPEVCGMVERAGYELACSTEKGLNTETTSPFALRRINVRRDTSVPVFAMKLLRGRKMADSQALRILQVCSASQAVYGAVQSLMVLAKAQREVGHIVEFLTFKGKAFGEQVREEGFVVHEVAVRAKIDPMAILRMRRVMKTGRFDIVHTHLSTSSVNGCLAARVAGLPSVATVHGMSSKISFAAANHMIAVSEEIKRHLVAQGAAPEQITVVYNGYSAASCDGLKAARTLPFPVLGTVSRVTPLKGIEDALRAVAILKQGFPDISYIVVGDGVGLDNSKALAVELDIASAVHFVGYRKDIENYLSQMDLFLFPSLKEGMGLALVEAMAQGLATVATNIGGIPEVITPEVGILVPPNSPGELAEKAAGLLRDEPKRKTMGAEAKNRAETIFSVPAMEQATAAVYRRLLTA